MSMSAAQAQPQTINATGKPAAGTNMLGSPTSSSVGPQRFNMTPTQAPATPQSNVAQFKTQPAANPAGNTDPNNALSEIGRAQQAYNQYMSAGRTDLANAAHTYADQQRALYTQNGGNAADVAAGKDLTGYYKGTGNAGVYDPTKSGQQLANNSSSSNGTPYTPPARPTMGAVGPYSQYMSQASAEYNPLRQNSLAQLAQQYARDQVGSDNIAAARGLDHSGLQVDALNKLAIGNQANMANVNNQYDSQIASLANNLQQQDRNYQLAQWQAANNNYNADQANKINVAGLTGQFNGAPTMAYNQQQFNNNMATQQFDLSKALQEANLTGKYNGQNTLPYQELLANYLGTFNGQKTTAQQQQDFNNALAMAGLTGYYNGNPTMAMQQMTNGNALNWAQLGQNQTQFNQQMAQNALANQQSMVLNKVNLISQLNNLPSDKAANYLQMFVNMGVFSPQEASGFINYWKQGQQVPTDTVGMYNGLYGPPNVTAGK